MRGVKPTLALPEYWTRVLELPDGVLLRERVHPVVGDALGALIIGTFACLFAKAGMLGLLIAAYAVCLFIGSRVKHRKIVRGQLPLWIGNGDSGDESRRHVLDPKSITHVELLYGYETGFEASFDYLAILVRVKHLEIDTVFLTKEYASAKACSTLQQLGRRLSERWDVSFRTDPKVPSRFATRLGEGLDEA